MTQALHQMTEKLAPYLQQVKPHFNRAVEYATPIIKQAHATFVRDHLPAIKNHKLEAAAAGVWVLYFSLKNPVATFFVATTAVFIYARIYGMTAPAPAAATTESGKTEKEKDKTN